MNVENHNKSESYITTDRQSIGHLSFKKNSSGLLPAALLTEALFMTPNCHCWGLGVHLTNFMAPVVVTALAEVRLAPINQTRNCLASTALCTSPFWWSSWQRLHTRSFVIPEAACPTSPRVNKASKIQIQRWPPSSATVLRYDLQRWLTLWLSLPPNWPSHTVSCLQVMAHITFSFPISVPSSVHLYSNSPTFKKNSNLVKEQNAFQVGCLSSILGRHKFSCKYICVCWAN